MDAAAHIPVSDWTANDIRALREARRMSVREFADHLGVSQRIVSRWEAATDASRPRPVNQAALDMSLRRADDDVRSRFLHYVAERRRR